MNKDIKKLAEEKGEHWKSLICDPCKALLLKKQIELGITDDKMPTWRTQMKMASMYRKLCPKCVAKLMGATK